MKRVFLLITLLLLATPVKSAQQTVTSGAGATHEWSVQKGRINSNFSELYAAAIPATGPWVTGKAYSTTTSAVVYNSNIYICNTSHTSGTFATDLASGKWSLWGANLYAPAMGSDDNYVTDAEKVKLSNLSGANTGDQTASTVAFSPNGSISSLTVQGAIQEVRDEAGGGGGGYTNLTSFTDQSSYRLFYSDGSGDVKELTFGSDGEYLKSNGGSSVPSWAVPTGSESTHGAVTLSADLGSNLLGLSTQELTLDSQTANYIFGAPNGSAGVPSFRAMVDGDIPSAIARDTELPTDATITTTDVTTQNASTTKHGWAPKATAPASGLISVLGIANGETVRTDKPLFDSTSPSTLAFGDSAVVGTGLQASRDDHKHAMPASSDDQTAAEVNITDTGSYFTGTTVEAALQEVGEDLGGAINLGIDTNTMVQTGTEPNITIGVKSGVYQAADTDLTTWAGVTPGTGVATALGNNLNASGGVQGALVSGTSIKTVNSTSLLGSGNIVITGTFAFDTFPTYEDSAHDSGIAVNANTLAIYSSTAGKWLTASLTDSLDPTPTTPTLSSRTIGEDGTTLTLVGSASLSVGAGGNGGFDVDCATAGSGITTTYASGAPGSSLVYTLGTTVNSGDTCDLDYTQPGNGIEATTGGADLASIPSGAITNASTQTPVAGADYIYELNDNASSATVVESVLGGSYNGSTIATNTSIMSTDSGCLDGRCFDMNNVTGGVRVVTHWDADDFNDGDFTIQVAFQIPLGVTWTANTRLITNTSNNSILVTFPTSSTLSVYFGTTSLGTVTIGDVITGEWTVLRLVFDTTQTDKLRVYRATTEAGLSSTPTATLTTAFGTTFPAGITNNEVYGNNTSTQCLDQYNGKIDQIKIWDAAVTP